MGHPVDGIVRRAASGVSFSNRRREPRACLVSGRTSPNSSGFCMYVFSNVTLSPTGMTGSSSPIALALFPFGVSRGRRACRDGDGRGRSGGPRSAARGEPRSAGRARRGTRRRARGSAGAEGESTEASKSPRNLCEKTRIRGLINRGPLIRFGGPHSQTTGAPWRINDITRAPRPLGPRSVKRASFSRTGAARGATRRHVRARHRGLARRYGGEVRRQPEHQPVPGAETRPAEQSRLVRARDPWTGGGGGRSERAERARSRRPQQTSRAVSGDTFAATRT